MGNRFLKFFALFAAAFAPAFAGLAAESNWARGELEKARAADAAAVAKIAAERAEIAARISRLAEESTSLDASLAAARAEASALATLSEKSKFYDSVWASVFETANRRFGAVSPSLESVERAVSERMQSLFNPLAQTDFTAVRAKTGEKLVGKTFRVGGFSYFVGNSTAGFLAESGALYGESRAKEIADFVGGRAGTLPADVSGGALFDAESKSRTFAEDVAVGGVLMYPILFFGLISLAVFLWKTASFARLRRAPKNAVSTVLSALEERGAEAAEAAARRMGYPYADMLSAMLESRNSPVSQLEEIAYEHMLSVGGRLHWGLSVLSVSATVAPLFGLLGTVTGIIKTFADLSAQGLGNARLLGAGIGEALITTEYGLIVAIPAFVAHAFLTRRARAVLADMEKLASSFLAAVKK